MGNTHPTFVKTPRGIEEVERKTHGLVLKSRQVLIMIDGKRDQVALQGIFPPEMVPAVLAELLAGGFIRELEKPKPTHAELSDEDDPFLLSQTFMINIARKILGVAGDGIIVKLKAAEDVDGLRALFPDWRNAVKQSPDGLQRMKEFETKLFHVLGEVQVASVKPEGGVKPKLFEAPKPPGTEDERLTMARNFMVNTTRTYLGIAADVFIAKASATRSIAELRQLFFDWREALKQSPDAKLRLAELESKLAALLS